jgi:hypothetical protein
MTKHKTPIPRLVMEVREQIQEDLLCYLDGRCGGYGASARKRDKRMKDRVCEIVVENFKKLLPPKDPGTNADCGAHNPEQGEHDEFNPH